MRLLCRRVVAGTPRPGREPPEAKTAQHVADAAFSQMHAEAGFDLPGQVDPPPAHHAVLGQGRSFADPPRHLGFLLGQQAGFGAGRHAIGQSRKPEFVITMHPVAKRLAIHAALLGLVRAAVAVQHQRERQHPSRRIRVLRPRRSPVPSSSVRTITTAILPSRTDESTANHAISALGIRCESRPTAAGIRQSSGAGAEVNVFPSQIKHLADRQPVKARKCAAAIAGGHKPTRSA